MPDKNLDKSLDNDKFISLVTTNDVVIYASYNLDEAKNKAKEWAEIVYSGVELIYREDHLSLAIFNSSKPGVIAVCTVTQIALNDDQRLSQHAMAWKDLIDIDRKIRNIQS